MTKRQKTILIVLSVVAACIILSSVLVFWAIPTVMRAHFRLQYGNLIVKYSEQYDLEPALVAGVIFTESSFRENATSRVGAKGLMQIMPDTGREIAEALGEPFDEAILYDPETSIRYGCYYLRKQMDRFDQNVAVTLAAYNAGPHRAEQWLSEYGLDSKGRIAYIPFEETRNYVDRVFQARENYANLYDWEALALKSEE
ncbi:MAG: lytic transglycosylase domain-containing protein [Clostridia bacterium]|nr:lytic transglycosylase domain-containing protein [Clostridia bacterium]